MLFENLPSRYWSVSQRLPVDCVQLPLTLAKTLYTGVEFDNLDIDSQGVDATITEGDTINDVEVEVENVGGETGDFDVTLEIIDSEQNVDIESTLTAPDVEPGDTRNVEFTPETSGLEPDTYDVEVSTEDDSVTGDLTVEAPAESDLDNLELAGTDLTENDVTITEGDDEEITVEVENVGDEAGTFDVDLEIDEDVTAGETQDVEETEEDVSVDAGETVTVTFDGVTDGLAVADNYDVQVSTEDDEITEVDTLDVELEETTLEVDGAQVAFNPFDDEEVPEEIEDVTVNVEETDDVTAENTEVSISIEDSGDSEVASDSVDVGALDGDEDVTLFEGDDSEELTEADDYDVTVTASADNADDATDSATFTLIPEQADLSIEDFSGELPDGETEPADLANVDITVDETADVEAENVEVTAVVTDDGGDGGEVASDSENLGAITAEGDATATLFEDGEADGLDADDYEVSVTVTADNAEDATDDETFTVQPD